MAEILTDSLPGGLSGLEELKLLINSGKRSAMGRTLDFYFTHVEEDLVVFEATPGPHVYNPIGTVHGGYAATLLDTACGCAVHAHLGAGLAYLTLELKVAYHKAITKETGLVRAEGRVASIGKRAAFAEGKLLDATGRLLASATSSLLVMPRPN